MLEERKNTCWLKIFSIIIILSKAFTFSLRSYWHLVFPLHFPVFQIHVFPFKHLSDHFLNEFLNAIIPHIRTDFLPLNPQHQTQLLNCFSRYFCVLIDITFIPHEKLLTITINSFVFDTPFQIVKRFFVGETIDKKYSITPSKMQW